MNTVTPTQNLRYTVSIYDEDTLLTDHGNNDSQYIVTGEELQKLFHSKVTFIPEPGLRWTVQNGMKKTCLLEIPHQKTPHSIGYRGKGKKEVFFDLILPSMVFRFEINTSSNHQETMNNIHGWCFSGHLTDTTPLYEIPLPNFSNSDFCVGTANTAHRGSLRETLEQVILSSWFNTHRDQCGKKRLSLPDFVKDCNGKVRLNQCVRIGTGSDVLRPK